MAEAWVLRRAVLDELEQGRPVMVLGDFNDGEHAVSSGDHLRRGAVQELFLDAAP